MKQLEGRSGVRGRRTPFCLGEGLRRSCCVFRLFSSRGRSLFAPIVDWLITFEPEKRYRALQPPQITFMLDDRVPTRGKHLISNCIADRLPPDAQAAGQQVSPYGLADVQNFVHAKLHNTQKMYRLVTFQSDIHFL